MKPPHARKPRPLPAGGRISERTEMMRLVHGDEEAWECIGHPEIGGKAKVTPAEYERARLRMLKEAPITNRTGTFDEHVWSDASVDAWRRGQHERLRFLLLNDLLAGEALEAGTKLKRDHEAREWRHK